MVRYKRYRRKYKSRVVKMKFQSFVDISTEADKMKIISINAGGSDVFKRLTPFFQAYKYYKLGGVSIKMIPASTLPVDPTGLSYDLGENTVDPRDQLTPGMCRITNGEDVFENITGMGGDAQRELYNNMLLDPRWFKWMLQSGVKRFAKPKYWQIGQLHQDKWPGAHQNMPIVNYNTQTQSRTFGGTEQITETYKNNANANPPSGEIIQKVTQGSSPYGIFQTGHRGVLGWMPTDSCVPFYDGSNETMKALIASIPEIELFKVLMPPMHKTNYYYRMFITETCYFKDPIVMNVNGYRPIDVFHDIKMPSPMLPSNNMPNTFTDDVIKVNTGGNDGSNKNL